jgi:hypothetical protein
LIEKTIYFSSTIVADYQLWYSPEFEAALEAAEALFVEDKLSEVESVRAVNQVGTDPAVLLPRLGFHANILIFLAEWGDSHQGHEFRSEHSHYKSCATRFFSKNIFVQKVMPSCSRKKTFMLTQKNKEETS